MIASLKLGSFKNFVAVAAAAVLTAGVTAAPEKAVIGGEAPDFTLTDLEGQKHTLSNFTKEGKVVVIEWYNPECPFVKKHYAGDKQPMNETHKQFKDDGVVWVRINSGAEGKQGAGLEKNKQYAEKYDLSGPVLLDTTGKVGKMYGAKRTPEMFIIGTDGKIHYHGAIDDNKSAKLKGDETNYVEAALRQVLSGETVTMRQTAPYGCGVKY